MIHVILLSLFCLSSVSAAFPRKRRSALSAKLQHAHTAPKVSGIDCFKTAIAGGIAGAVGTAALYPLDAAKTIRQASPDAYRSVRGALVHLIKTKAVYRGAWTAIIGAIPSSALYFGAYETAKRCLLAAQANLATKQPSAAPPAFAQRLLLHSSAAATGNLVSSAVFVPKELVKQRLQNAGTTSSTWLTVVSEIVREKGIVGLYTGYAATVLRNVPSAALRFGLYEELKRSWTKEHNSDETVPLLHWKMFAAGAVAGAIASGIMTPVDVIKTRVSTGTCPVDLPSCVQHVVQINGWSALFAGAGSRMAASAAFSSIGFGTFEAAKRLLRIPPMDIDPNPAMKRKLVSHNPIPLFDKEHHRGRLADRIQLVQSNQRSFIPRLLVTSS